MVKEPAGTAELRAQIADLTLEKAAYAGFASCTRRTARHVPYSVLHICSMPHVMQHAPATRHSAHQHLPCSPSTAVLPASTARTGGESATRTCHAAMRRQTTYTCQYLVHNAGVWLRSAHCRRSIQTSRRQIRSLKLLSAAQVMHRCDMVAARSAHSCAPPARAGLNARDVPA